MSQVSAGWSSEKVNERYLCTVNIQKKSYCTDFLWHLFHILLLFYCILLYSILYLYSWVVQYFILNFLLMSIWGTKHWRKLWVSVKYGLWFRLNVDVLELVWFFNLTLTFLKTPQSVAVLFSVTFSAQFVVCFMHTCVFFTEQHYLYLNSKETAATLLLQRKNLLTRRPACAGLWGVRRFSQDISFCYWQGCGGRQRLTSSAETQWRWSNDYVSHHALGLSGGVVGGASGLGSIFCLLILINWTHKYSSMV